MANALIVKHEKNLDSIQIEKFDIKIIDNASKRFERYLAVKTIAKSINAVEKPDILLTQAAMIDVEKDYGHITGPVEEPPKMLSPKIKQNF